MRLLMMCALVGACAAPTTEVVTPPSGSETVVLHNVRLPGQSDRVSITIRGDRIAAIGEAPTSEARAIDLAGAFVVPQVIDSHVHLSYLPVADRLAKHGVAGTVDLAAPLSALESASKRHLGSGPMLTAPRGYPTRSWGRDGYGLEIRSSDAGRDAVDHLASLGAGVIKLPLPGAGGLDAGAIAAITAQAHDRGIVVVGHAFTNEDVQIAAAAGVDILAHVPVEPLDEETIAAWAPRPVITTLAAFRPRQAARNLARLRARGSVALYGTDLGNAQIDGISVGEISAMQIAGMTGADILESMTEIPARVWGMKVGHRVEVGGRACLMALETDPHENPTSLASPSWVSPCPPG